MRKAALIVPALAAAVAIIVAADSGQADVSLRNGNYFVKYTDASFPGGLEPKIERVYNSKTEFKGIFGWGWGIQYETYIEVLGDGTVALHEHGGGAENFFVPPALSGRDIDLAVEQLANARASERDATTDSLIAYRSRLRDDATFRSREWARLTRTGKIARRELPEGTHLRSLRFGLQDFVKLASGYQRTDGSGKAEQYDAAGRLIRVTKGKQWLALTRDEQGRLLSVTDQWGRVISLVYGPRGLVERVRRGDSTTVRLRYDERDNLVEAIAAGGDRTRFGYDARHNLTLLVKDDDTTRITYYAQSGNDNVRTVENDGTVETYEYVTDPQDPRHTLVRTTTTGRSWRQDTTVSVTEYWERSRSNGAVWTERVVNTVDGVRTARYYNECCGLLIGVVRKDDSTVFEYDREGRVLRKESRTEVDSLSYDPASGKTTLIVRRVKGDPERKWTSFQYDAKGNLAAAENYERSFVRLQYDDDDRVKEMVGSTGKLTFKYNELGKPIRIELDTVGVIDVQYDADGEIKKVDSPNGHKTALAVTQAFQNLLNLVNMKDVSACRLSFEAYVCGGLEKPLREPTPLPEGAACGGGETRCRTSLRREPDLSVMLAALPQSR